jgi:hypothetical protein
MILLEVHVLGPPSRLLDLSPGCSYGRATSLPGCLPLLRSLVSFVRCASCFGWNPSDFFAKPHSSRFIRNLPSPLKPAYWDQIFGLPDLYIRSGRVWL